MSNKAKKVAELNIAVSNPKDEKFKGFADRDAVAEALADAGALVINNVNKGVDVVVAQSSDDRSTNVKRAKKLKIPIVLPSFAKKISSGVEEIKIGDYLVEDASSEDEEDKKKSKKSKSKDDMEVDGDEDEDGDDNKNKKNTKDNEKKRARRDKSEDSDDDESKKEEEEGEKRPKKVKMVKKGRCVVDTVCPAASKSHVLEEGDVIWNATLNCADVSYNVKGHNKFYIIQLLESDDKKKYSVWNRWGRVGATGQSVIKDFANVLAAKKDFEKKFQDKTGNPWSNHKSFKPKSGKYTLVEIDYGDEEDINEDDIKEKMKKRQELEKQRSKIPSKLDKPLQELIQLIYNLSMMEHTLIEMDYDIKKCPLGKLKKAHIEKGYAVLKKIEAFMAGRGGNENLVELSNQFYSLIPHNFGFSKPPVINSEKSLKSKLLMLETLGDIEIATNILKNAEDESLKENIVDSNYKALKTQLTTMDKETKEYNIIHDYLHNTHATTHSQYTLTVMDAWKVNRNGEEKKFLDYSKDINPHMLLWHGSRLTNFVGILSQGLRIAPPEAPVTGYMFGKGLYFADMSSKSANYCFASKENPYGLLLLVQVAVGSTYDLTAAKYVTKLPAGTHSTKGCGGTEPDPKDTIKLDDGTIVPMGKGVATGVAGALLYNEYIVYNVDQAVIRYLLKVKFNYKK
eukprot:TRINITY_DN5107_c0_g1_i1.p1 TRINITY_DN5107_c0_g1~~TRINITY_DN5107_c0_g1_i1.p1  ORF type:complete len:682 (-),score=251.83 TRINITY_DN5107_c0_g1_i1:117-2162(-)